MAAPTRVSDPAVVTRRAAGSTAFRTDIQGLRALAVGLVLLYHAGTPGVSGGYVGVDVFFVISGFLITGLIVREVETTGRLNLTRFYARRARRLLPAAALATVAVALMTVLVLPVTRWRDVAGDLLASSVYLVNWRLADRSVDYLGAESATSPLQHFWSLAVEEQFYVVWPLLIIVLLHWQRRSQAPLRRTLLLGLVAVAVPSLLWSVWLTVEEPGRAYFVTTTRLWELAVGGLLVFGVTRFATWGPTTRGVVGWAGFVAIVYAAVTYDASTAFPGASALVPTLGAAAVIAAGVDGRAPGLARVLGAPVMQDVGAASYSLYLWHWPVVVGATALWGSEEGLALPVALAAVAFSVLPAWLAYRFVEKPVHETRALAAPSRALPIGLLCVLVGLASAWTVSTALARETADGPAGDVLGARALGAAPESTAGAVLAQTPGTVTPHPAEAVEDGPEVDGKSCLGPTNSPDRTDCSLGDADAETVVAVAGDSKMEQWLPALTAIAERRGWRVETDLMGACPLSLARTHRNGDTYEECDEANLRRVEEIAEDPEVDVVITTQGAVAAYSADAEEEATAGERMRAGILEAWERLEEGGKEVVVLRDNPHPGFEVAECVGEHLDEPSACDFTWDGAATPLLAAAEEADVPVVDLLPWICPTGACPAVVGDALVYRVGSHLTATYVRTMAPYLEEQLVAAGVP